MEMQWIVAGVLGGVFVLWTLLHMKTSRPDGKLVTNFHPYRRIMWFIMPTRAESVVYFDHLINAEPMLAYLEEVKEKFDANMMNILVAACGRGLIQNPEMDKFVAGFRLYQRKTSTISFSMKRKRGNAKSKIATVKEEIRFGDTIQSLTERIDSKVNVERSDTKTYADKEFQLFNMLPRPIFKIAFDFVRKLDYFNLLPGAYIKDDPLFTSIFMANLGSVGMGAGYHHLFEYGNCPLFIMVGKIEERAVVEDGEVVIRKMMQVRFTYDERIDDGMTAGRGIATMAETLADPRKYLGCVEADGSDQVTLGAPESDDDL